MQLYVYIYIHNSVTIQYTYLYESRFQLQLNKFKVSTQCNSRELQRIKRIFFFSIISYIHYTSTI